MAAGPLIPSGLLQSATHKIRFAARSGPEIEVKAEVRACRNAFHIALRKTCKLRLSLRYASFFDAFAFGSMFAAAF
jgi:hypothetical protein